MKRTTLLFAFGIAAVSALSAIAVQAAPQFAESARRVPLHVSTWPKNIRHDYSVFADKCSECHSLSRSLNEARSLGGWEAEVQRMEDMASSHINDRQAAAITQFLSYYDRHEKHATPSPTSESSGWKLFERYNCSACHSIAGRGNASFPLDGIGSRRTPVELRQQIVSPPGGGGMPPMAVPEADLNRLVGYLAALKSR